MWRRVLWQRGCIAWEEHAVCYICGARALIGPRPLPTQQTTQKTNIRDWNPRSQQSCSHRPTPQTAQVYISALFHDGHLRYLCGAEESHIYPEDGGSRLHQNARTYLRFSEILCPHLQGILQHSWEPSLQVPHISHETGFNSPYRSKRNPPFLFLTLTTGHEIIPICSDIAVRHAKYLQIRGV